MPDQEFVCRDCGAACLFTEAEQEYFRAQGFNHPPKRCKACRARQRQRDGRDVHVQRAAAGPGAHVAARDAPRAPHDAASFATSFATSRDPAESAAAAAHGAIADPATAPRPPRPPRPMHATTCSLCGQATEVPFVPDGVRPVYCLPCLKKQTR